MSPFYTGLIIGCIIGFAFGVCLISILSINRENNIIAELERMRRLLGP